MANDRLRTAMLGAGLKVEHLASAAGVDPKTVERWITSERVPHPPNRKAIAERLNHREVDLWPSLAGDPLAPQVTSELAHLYPARAAIGGAVWQSLIAGAQEQMDVLVFSGAFLVEQYDLIPTVRTKAASGVRFRFLVGDENSEAMKLRATEEGTPGGLEGRTQLMRRYLHEVCHIDGVEVRTHGTTLYNSLYRFDDNLLVNVHAYGALAGQSPVMHLKRVDNGEIWDYYMRAFERVWAAAEPEHSLDNNHNGTH